MDGVSTTFHADRCLFSPPKAAANGCAPAVRPADGEAYSRDEAAAEARRCLKCDCSACFDRCELMQSIRQYPIKMAKDATVSMFAVPELDGKRISTRIVGTCLQCGACGEFCSSGIDMEKFFSDFRRMMAEDESLPAPFHDFFIQDLRFTESDDARLVRAAPSGASGAGGANASGSQGSTSIAPASPAVSDAPDASTVRISACGGYAFFPGCQLGGAIPEAVKQTYALLLENMPDTAFMMACCGVPAHWGGQAELFQTHLDRIRRDWGSLGKPTLILACVTCQKTFEKFLPEIPVASLYEMLAGFALPASAAVASPGVSAAVFDPCSSRVRPAIQQSVRHLAQSIGYAIEELENSCVEAECCGYGGHAHFAKAGYTDAIAAKRTRGSDLPYLVYCANCRETFAEKGKDCRHILEALFGMESSRTAVTKSDRRQNRRQLKADMLKDFWGEESGAVFSPSGSLAISDEMKEKLSRNYIVADDLLEAIRQAEESGRVLCNPDTGIRIAHIRVGSRTYWSKYSKHADGGYELKNAYSHRIAIDED
jgi:Fe-S oxidoreductase